MGQVAGGKTLEHAHQCLVVPCRLQGVVISLKLIPAAQSGSKDGRQQVHRCKEHGEKD